MNRLQLTRALIAAADDNAIVELLTARQHAHPRETVAQSMEHATRTLGCCPAAIARAIEWLKLDANRPVGRLRRSELLQLARSVYRFWRHTTPPSRGSAERAPAQPQTTPSTT